MNEAQKAALSVPARLAWKEICARHADEWVVLVDAELIQTRTVAGVVYAHSPSRREAGRLASGLRDCAIFWTGKIESPTLWFMTHARRDV
jgi:hypothetical protein